MAVLSSSSASSTASPILRTAGLSNLASAYVGAEVVAASSELPGAEATNTLYDSPQLCACWLAARTGSIRRVWRSGAGLPQWIVVHLLPSGAPQLGLGRDSVRSIGWSCGSSSSTNPLEVAIHASRDGSRCVVAVPFSETRLDSQLASRRRARGAERRSSGETALRAASTAPRLRRALREVHRECDFERGSLLDRRRLLQRRARRRRPARRRLPRVERRLDSGRHRGGPPRAVRRLHRTYRRRSPVLGAPPTRALCASGLATRSDALARRRASTSPDRGASRRSRKRGSPRWLPPSQGQARGDRSTSSNECSKRSNQINRGARPSRRARRSRRSRTRADGQGRRRAHSRGSRPTWRKDLASGPVEDPKLGRRLPRRPGSPDRRPRESLGEMRRSASRRRVGHPEARPRRPLLGSRSRASRLYATTLRRTQGAPSRASRRCATKFEPTRVGLSSFASRLAPTRNEPDARRVALGRTPSASQTCDGDSSLKRPRRARPPPRLRRRGRGGNPATRDLPRRLRNLGHCHRLLCRAHRCETTRSFLRRSGATPSSSPRRRRRTPPPKPSRAP